MNNEFDDWLDFKTKMIKQFCKRIPGSVPSTVRWFVRTGIDIGDFGDETVQAVKAEVSFVVCSEDAVESCIEKCNCTGASEIYFDDSLVLMYSNFPKVDTSVLDSSSLKYDDSFLFWGKTIPYGSI